MLGKYILVSLILILLFSIMPSFKSTNNILLDDRYSIALATIGPFTVYKDFSVRKYYLRTSNLSHRTYLIPDDHFDDDFDFVEGFYDNIMNILFLATKSIDNDKCCQILKICPTSGVTKAITIDVFEQCHLNRTFPLNICDIVSVTYSQINLVFTKEHEENLENLVLCYNDETDLFETNQCYKSIDYRNLISTPVN